MPRRPPLSRAEWALMNICWRLGRSTARQVHSEAVKTKKREYRTIKTQLDRMADKGYLRVEKLGPLCLFRPAVQRGAAVASAIDEFIGTVLDESLAPLFLHLSQEREISPEELESLKRLLRERERGGRKKKRK